MAKLELHNRVLEMRKLGMSYTQIKEAVAVSKSTLSSWLKDYPLSEERIRELRDRSEIRIEKCRETKAFKKRVRTENVSKMVSERIGTFSDRELFLAGLLLYWAEGTKAAETSLVVTNTDPAMIQLFLRWFDLLNVPQSRLRVRLHLYADMDTKKEVDFWTTELGIPKEQFRKAYIKETSQDKRKNYKGRFGHGTCNISFGNRDCYEMVMSGIEHLRTLYGGIDFESTKRV